MIQNSIKVLTLGFFISMITGFVLYRSGYFEADEKTYSFQTSSNGGELLIAIIDQDTNQVPQINQMNEDRIMPSSKSMTPVIELKKMDQIMSSSKSITHIIDFSPPPNVEEQNRQAIKVQPEIIPIDSPRIEKTEIKKSLLNRSISNQVDTGDEPKIEEKKTKGIDWRVIGLGILGIFFVGIGAIVYFKRKMK